MEEFCFVTLQNSNGYKTSTVHQANNNYFVDSIRDIKLYKYNYKVEEQAHQHSDIKH